MNKLSREQAVVVSAYTGYLICDFTDLHKYIELKMGRPVFTHEMGSEAFQSYLTALCKEDFLSLAPLK